MPDEKETSRGHGDKLKDVTGNQNNPEDNQAQAQSDANADALGGARGGAREETDRDEGRGSTANGVPASDEDAGALRKRQYKDGAELVSGID